MIYYFVLEREETLIFVTKKAELIVAEGRIVVTRNSGVGEKGRLEKKKKSRTVVARACGEKVMGNCCLIGTELQFCKMDGGEGCTTT